jgi:hypothetical protein
MANSIRSAAMLGAVAAVEHEFPGSNTGLERDDDDDFSARWSHDGSSGSARR